MNIGTVIGWKFNNQEGMATVDGIITEFPNGIPTQAEQDLWTAEYNNEGAFEMAMADLRQKRNALLSSTDYLALSDNTLPPTTATYRQALRDLTVGLTTKDEVEAVVFPTKP